MWLYRFCNFGNVLSLQKLYNDDIIHTQQMARNELKKWLDEKLGEVDLIDYFGPIYNSKPEQFEFTRGNVKMMCQISEYLQTTVRKNSYWYFKGKHNQCPKNVKQCETNENDDNEVEIQEKLFDGVSNLLLPYGQDVVKLFKKEMAIVKNEKGTISGRVRCVLCDRDSDFELFQPVPTIIYVHPIQSDANQQTATSQVAIQS